MTGTMRIMLAGRTPEAAADRLAREAVVFAAALRQASAADRALAALDRPGTDEARAYVGGLWRREVDRHLGAVVDGYDGVARATEHRP